MEELYKVGDRMQVQDTITEDIEEGTITFIEPDGIDSPYVWVYIKSDNDKLNDKIDAKFGSYWKMFEVDDCHIQKA